MVHHIDRFSSIYFSVVGSLYRRWTHRGREICYQSSNGNVDDGGHGNILPPLLPAPTILWQCSSAVLDKLGWQEGRIILIRNYAQNCLESVAAKRD